MVRENIIAALDIGTKKVVTLIAQIGADGRIVFIGKGVAENSKGLIAGDVVDVQATAKTIQESVAEAEKISSKHIKSVYVSISGERVCSMNSHGVIQVRGREVAQTDIDRVIEQAKIVTMPDDSDIINVEIGEYTVDGRGGIRNPKGMAGRKLEVDVLIVTASRTMLRNLIKAVEDSGLKLDDVLVSGIASSWAILEEDEKNLGVAMVDIGEGVADIAIYHKGDPVYVSVLPMGGKFITDDISKVMKIPPVEAEKIKCKHGSARPDYVADSEEFKTVIIGTNAETTKKAKQLSTVMTPRIEEILVEIKKKLASSQKESLIQTDIVITGGTSSLKDIKYVAEDIFEQQVRVGIPKIQDADCAFPKVLSSPEFSTAVGIINYFAVHKNMKFGKKDGFFARKWARVCNFFKNFVE
ncbi:cell division protein FtsA [bacterium]|nr:cell division protein FtsA [bacterium]